MAKTMQLAEPKSDADLWKTSDDELWNLVNRAQNGDASTLPALREFLQDPSAVDRLGVNLARVAEHSLIAAVAGDNLFFRESLSRKLEMLRADLAGPCPTPIERLLVERIVACWLQVQDADARYAHAKNLSLEWGEYYQRRMDRAHRRYLSAIKTLAVVRKLAVPVLQVNIAPEQIQDQRGETTRQDGGGRHARARSTRSRGRAPRPAAARGATEGPCYAPGRRR